MLDAGNLNHLNRVLDSLEDRIELSDTERRNYFHSDSSVPPPKPDDRRRFHRRPLRMRAVMDLRQSLPGIEREPTQHCVYLRDISRTGIGFLHADELFPGEECRLRLPQRELHVTVVLCTRLGPHRYLIGAQFCQR